MSQTTKNLGVYAEGEGSSATVNGDVAGIVSVKDGEAAILGDITVEADGFPCVYVEGGSVTITGDINAKGDENTGIYVNDGFVTMTGDIIADGDESTGIYVTPNGGSVTMTGDIITKGDESTGISMEGGSVDITGDITAEGASIGILMDDGSVTMTGGITAAFGIVAYGGSVTMTGDIAASMGGMAALGGADVEITGDIVLPDNPDLPLIYGITVEDATVTLDGTITAPIGVMSNDPDGFVTVNGSITASDYIVFMDGESLISLTQEEYTGTGGGYLKYTREDCGAVWVTGTAPEPISAPVRERVYTYEPTAITGSGASLSGGIGGLDASRVTEYGFVLSTDVNPIWGGAGTLKVNAPSTGFAAPVTGLEPATTYYVRAYVVADGATYYGNVMSFVTGGTADVSVPNTGDGAGFVPFLALGAALFLSAYALTLRKRA